MLGQSQAIGSDDITDLDLLQAVQNCLQKHLRMIVQANVHVLKHTV